MEYPYGWYDDYRDYGWNNNNYNQGQQGSSDNKLVAEAEMLCGVWAGEMTYSFVNSDETSRSTEKYYTEMEFYQYGSSSSATSGNGIEVDYLYNDDGSVNTDQSQQLRFSWYLSDDGDIYIQYNDSKATFVMDAAAKVYGFYLGYDKNVQNDAFEGYMIGTGSVSGDVIYINLERKNTQGYNLSVAEGTTGVSRAAGSRQSYGQTIAFSPIPACKAADFNKRR